MESQALPTKAGIIRRISVQNFMCHSSLTIELGERVNFITGQNGSGKSAILTALCVAFGISAKGTQRASSMKDFIKNGCRQATVTVELSNEGDDAFKPAVYGDTMIVERRIFDNRTTFCIKDGQGQKLGTKKEDIMEIVEHFNIDVDNPCVIMTQDKSREFLHTGNDKDKFKFFYKATLLQQVHDLLSEWEEMQEQTRHIIDELVDELKDVREEHRQIQIRLEAVQRVEGYRSDIQKLERLFLWSDVREKENELDKEKAKLTNMEERIPKCQALIDKAQLEVTQRTELKDEKTAFVTSLEDRIKGLKDSQAQLENAHTKALNEKTRASTISANARKNLSKTRAKLADYAKANDEMLQKMMQDRQAEKDAKDDQIRSVERMRNEAEELLQTLQNEEMALGSQVGVLGADRATVAKEISDRKSQLRETEKLIQDLQSQQTTPVTAFGGDIVLRLMHEIEINRARFSTPPKGPIGNYLALIDGNWTLALEVAVGGFLNNFVVANHQDGLLLRELGKRVQYYNLNFSVQNFDRPRIRPTERDLPSGGLLTVLASLQSDEPIVINTLIDQGRIEQKVLVEADDEGKVVAFSGRYRNVAEVILKDGTRLFQRAGAETSLPIEGHIRRGRLGVRFDEQILQAQAQERVIRTDIREVESRKRKLDDEFSTLENEVGSLKRRKAATERNLRQKDSTLRDLRTKFAFDSESDPELRVMVLEKEIENADLQATQGEIASNENNLQDSEVALGEATRVWDEAKSRLEEFTDSARGDLQALNTAAQAVSNIQEDLEKSLQSLARFQATMRDNVLGQIQKQEEIVKKMRSGVERSLEDVRKLYPDDEGPTSEEMCQNRHQLSARIKVLEQAVKRQENSGESMESLQRVERKLRRRIHSTDDWFNNLGRKLDLLRERLEDRQKLYRRNCVILRRELTWKFDQHLRRKGFNGTVTVDFDSHTLKLKIHMPQDASNTAVHDTRALSGGERSYSTLAFTLAVHGMIEAPFRAMDEFDVFMDAVSRKISLDALVEYAKQDGSQWIFITPHDISMVQGNELVKKQEMPAPRG